MNDPGMQALLWIVGLIMVLAAFFAQMRLFEIAAILRRIEKQITRPSAALTPAQEPSPEQLPDGPGSHPRPPLAKGQLIFAVVVLIVAVAIVAITVAHT